MEIILLYIKIEEKFLKMDNEQNFYFVIGNK